MKTLDYKSHTIQISIHQDTDAGAPWKESDGHGIISEWTNRDKAPGEWVLCSDRNSRRFYDFEATTKLAKKDGWGLSDESKMDLAKKLGRNPTAKEVIAESVRHDFEYLRGWCRDEWTFQGYTTEILTADGETIQGDSCWGFEGTADGEKYMIQEATSQAQFQIDKMILTAEQTEIAACVP